MIAFATNNSSPDKMNMPQHPISHCTPTIRPVITAGLRFTSLLIYLGLPIAGWAQTGELMLKPNSERLGTAGAPAGALPLESFKYIPPAGVGKTQEVLEAVKRTPEQQRILDFNTAGNYQAAGTEGLALMSREKLADDLQLIVANSLAWTGRTKEAIPSYQGLANGKYANEANIGIANLFRWNGREDQAAPLYRAVLAVDPENKDAIEGLELSGRELRPRTTVSFGGSRDSSEIQVRVATINHRWRDSTGSRIMEIEASAVRDTLPTVQTKQPEATFRYQALDLVLKPSFEISSASKISLTGNNGANLFASGRINLFDDQLSLQAGRINWGRISTNPNGLAANLAAWNAGLTWNQALSFGRLTARGNYYTVSDGNRIVTSSVNLKSSWQPLGSHFSPFVGFETRDAKFNSSNYWSPAQGYGAAYAGVIAEFAGPEWNFYTSVQAGVPLYGDSGNSWSLQAGGKRWVTSDVSIGFNTGVLSSKRDSAVYKSRSANVSVEKLWN